MNTELAGDPASSSPIYLIAVVLGILRSFLCLDVRQPLKSIAAAPAPPRGHLYLVSGFLWTVYHYTTTPRYYFAVLILTPWAWITGQSFVLRRHPRLPRLIARQSNTLRAFWLTNDDICAIYGLTGIRLEIHQSRRWRPQELISTKLLLHRPPLLPIAKETFDFHPYRLDGRRLTQCQGLIGHKRCFVLLEELGRWPKNKRVITGNVFDFIREKTIIGRFPVTYLLATGVEESVIEEGMRITIPWVDLGKAIMQGPQLTVVPIGPDPAPVTFTTGPLSPGAPYDDAPLNVPYSRPPIVIEIDSSSDDSHNA